MLLLALAFPCPGRGNGFAVQEFRSIAILIVNIRHAVLIQRNYGGPPRIVRSAGSAFRGLPVPCVRSVRLLRLPKGGQGRQ